MSPIVVPVELILFLSFAAGMSVGYFLRERVFVSERGEWTRERTSLVRRVQCPTPEQYVAVTAAEKSIEESEPPPPIPPWDKDPSLRGVEVVLDFDTNLVHFTQGEDCWEEDMDPFLAGYGLNHGEAKNLSVA